jgi:hypothetical protein
VINEAYRGRHYCIIYGWTAFDYSRMALVKKNVCDPSRDLVWTLQDHYSSEAWFFQRPGLILLNYVCQLPTGRKIYSSC